MIDVDMKFVSSGGDRSCFAFCNALQMENWYDASG
jgi:hypothetical protein